MEIEKQRGISRGGGFDQTLLLIDGMKMDDVAWHYWKGLFKT